MKRLLTGVLVLFILLISVTGQPAFAADLENGAKVFSVSCAACHGGGGNFVNATKTLKKEALEQFSMVSIDAIKTQVTNGKAAMPAFKGRLSDQEIADVAAYVLDQAEQGW